MSRVKDATIDCPDCGGYGVFTEHRGPGREAGFGFVPEEIVHVCPTCDGRGDLLTAPPARPHAPADTGPEPDLPF